MAQTSQRAPEVSLPALWSLFAGHPTLHCSPLLRGDAQETREDVSPQDKLETEENMRGFIIFFSEKKNQKPGHAGCTLKCLKLQIFSAGWFSAILYLKICE